VAPAPVAPAAGRETRVPIRGLRKKISEKMHLSKSTAAHFTYVDEVDVTELVALRKELKESAAKRGVKLTYLPFIMKAVASAMRLFPTLNGVTDDARQEFVIRHAMNFGIAVDTENGLIVPVVKDVDRRSLLDLASEIERLSTAARDGKSAMEDLKDGSFTITNAGNIGGLFATPVINYPEAAILGVHAIKRKPWIVKDASGAETIAIRDIMYLSVSIDHRMNDGATGARWMNHIVELLQDPRGRLLLEM
jgi:pyruvate dehydrogenase E2 component (dihydrolipoamide acetyltransferase)